MTPNEAFAAGVVAYVEWDSRDAIAGYYTARLKARMQWSRTADMPHEFRLADALHLAFVDGWRSAHEREAVEA